MMMTQEEIHNVFQQVHQAWPISLAGTAIIGLVLWLMGRKMIRPAMGVCGIFIGASVGFTLSHKFQANDGLLMTWTGVGAVAGALAVWLLYRAWMAISLGLLAIVIVPATAIAFTGTPDPDAGPKPPAIDRNIADQSSQTKDTARIDATKDSVASTKDDASNANKDASSGTGFPPINSLIGEEIDKTIDASIEQGKEAIGGMIEEVKTTLIDAIRAAFDNQSEYINAWWDAMDDGQRKSVLTTTAIGFGIALLVGFMLPNVTASIETAFIGTVMLFIALRGILATYSENEISWLPSEPRQIFITIGLITALGITLQWTFFRKAADK